jgi:hypothetical protein
VTILATAQIKSVAREEDDAEVSEVVTVKFKANCQCPSCNFRNAVLFMGVVLQLVNESGQSLGEIESHAIGMFNISNTEAVIH